MTMEYGATIETLQDVIKSEKLLLMARNMGGEEYFSSDPRKMVQELERKVEYYSYTVDGHPDWVEDG